VSPCLGQPNPCALPHPPDNAGLPEYSIHFGSQSLKSGGALGVLLACVKLGGKPATLGAYVPTRRALPASVFGIGVFGVGLGMFMTFTEFQKLLWPYIMSCNISITYFEPGLVKVTLLWVAASHER
jgi:hypothetical protein